MLRVPLRLLYTKNVTSTASSTDTFTLPLSDFGSLVAKFTVSTLVSGSGSTPNLNLYIQTTDDGGTTWYDVVALPQATGIVTTAAANWANFSVYGAGRGTVIASASDATLGAPGVSGLPLLTNQAKIKWVYANMASTTATASWNFYLYANNQSPHA